MSSNNVRILLQSSSMENVEVLQNYTGDLNQRRLDELKDSGTLPDGWFIWQADDMNAFTAFHSEFLNGALVYHGLVVLVPVIL